LRSTPWKHLPRPGNTPRAGLVDVVGIGEAPVGRLATFSLWESLEAATRFAYSMRRHERVIEQTRDGDWYSEEMFARFEPFSFRGTWNGSDPLASRLDG